MSYCWETNRGYKPLAQWVSTSNGAVPQKAVVGGNDITGENLYIGRASHDGEIIPGKVVQSHGTCYVAYGGLEHSKRVYQVLVHSSCATDFVWIDASSGEIPTGAVQGGVSANSERIFIGRVNHEGSMCIGKVHPTHRCCYIAFGGREHSYRRYEVLCVKHIPLEH